MESASTITNLSGPAPFAQVWVSITRQEQIEVTCRLHYLEAQNQILKNKLEQALQETIRQKAKNKDLQNRLFGRKSEKASSKKSEQSGSADNDSVIGRLQDSCRLKLKITPPFFPFFLDSNELRLLDPSF